MTRIPLRSVSVMLVVLLATLASADVLCLLPCEVRTTAARQAAADGSLDHCGTTTASNAADTVLSGRGDACAGQHAWDVPAVDRTITRTSPAPALVSSALVIDGSDAAAVSDHLTRRLRHDPPGDGAHTSPPLRI